ncbi:MULTISPECIES: FxsA family protein [unclassified Mesorhizobium]|uniref:FxsA family protein n=1 Tax=unclassified Mesorhizobium TaxID=325217 RepID=UPI000F755FB3|nr:MULTISPECIES: FxsA family protein [unclassified Mesorhizobium]AZO04229.1 membrane protein FxsA [Mesorhizobium sp. M2A.F.Ca.ET.043.02.1.1]RUW36771.1 membrane protein FxsA [Mesorhizobium sp. M2A.F.Ca.ET.015.02.1.1]RUW69995.1 membrane protein FxsA [Mesorhizobium sp. M2A.F.Ca.ET.067.02.1.1]RVC90571.1 membrane protein FxsA [Mesorhizobium sp. M2A.F.Ca.ET.017.03.2.1]RVD07709.1 membrane protein FxsA [Mesorhizobium sp. M2A.F.Ca.ET.029.05.1.1]
MRISFIPLFLLLLPLLEIAGFVVVGREIGALATVGLVILSSVAGSLLLRHQGFGVMTRVRAEMDAGHDPSRQLAHGAMIVLAAILLIIPGFITDIFAILLLLPPVRDFAWRLFKSRIVMATSFSSGFSARRRETVIDLDDSDYSRDDYPNRPDHNSPWRRLKND